jgi:hypothetical protein
MELSLKSWLPNLFKRKRKEDRAPQRLPVKVLNDEGKGVTRDVSPSSVYFEADKHYEVGTTITMTIDFEIPPGTQLRCVGTVVRVEDRGSTVGVAVRMKADEAWIVVA